MAKLRHPVLLLFILVVVNTEPPPEQYGPPPSYTGESRQEQATPPGRYGPPNYSAGQPLGDGNSGGGSCRNMDGKANEQLVVDFFNQALGDKRDGLDRYLAQDYLNHSPFSSSQGIQDFEALIRGPLAAAPPQRINFRRVNSIGDIVWTHSSWVLGTSTYADMSIWRINCDGLIQEHWDVIQNVNMTQTRNPVAFF